MKKVGTPLPPKYNNNKLGRYKEIKNWLLFVKYVGKQDDTKDAQKFYKKKNGF